MADVYICNQHGESEPCSQCPRASVVAPQGDAAARIAQILNEDRCMWCGGKTEHKPDCDHGVRPSPASSPVPPEQGLRDLLSEFLWDKYGCTIEHHRMKVLKHFVEWVEARPAATPTPVEQERELWNEAASIVQACLNVHSTYSDAEREFAAHLIEVFNTRDQHPDYKHRNTVRAYPATTPPAVTSDNDELERVLSLLISYGAIHTVEGVKYPDGTHAEALKAAERICDRLRARGAVTEAGERERYEHVVVNGGNPSVVAIRFETPEKTKQFIALFQQSRGKISNE